MVEQQCTALPTYLYSETLSYLILRAEDFDDLVTYDNVIQVEYDLDLD